MTPAQRDLLTRELPPSLAHVLRHAVVREGKLAIRASREEIERLIAAVARREVPDRPTQYALMALARYLETVADRFEDPDDRSPEF